MLVNRYVAGICLKDIHIYLELNKYIASRYHTTPNRKYTNVSSTVSGHVYLPVPDFYAGKSVFITGGSGFVGKVLVQRILDTCKDVNKVYVLIRPKREEDAERRLEKIIDTALFGSLRNKKPEVLKKIIPIAGDLTADKLGIKAEDERTLTEKVSVVFHSAANVKLTEPLREALNVNLEGTIKVLELSKRMKNIQAFVHISTAYSNADKRVIEEKMYPPPAKLKDVYKFLQENGQEKGTKFQEILNGKPNTYLFTKALAESYVAENHGHVPAIIIRPSIMTPIAKEPLPGWMDKLFAASILLYNVGAGLNRVTYGDGNNAMNLIPVDYTCNHAIIAATRCNQSKTVEVYNSSVDSLNPLSWRDVYQQFIDETVQSGLCELPYPKLIFTKSRVMMKLMTFLLMMTPAYVADFWVHKTGRPSQYRHTMREVIALRDSVENFTSQHWRVVGDKARLLSASLSANDRKLLPCDSSDLNWSEYLPLFSREVRRHLRCKRKYLNAKSKA